MNLVRLNSEYPFDLVAKAMQFVAALGSHGVRVHVCVVRLSERRSGAARPPSRAQDLETSPVACSVHSKLSLLSELLR